MPKFSYNVKEWYMPETVIGKYVKREGHTSDSSFAVHIPVLMPAIPFDTQKDTVKALSTSCYCNDAKCKPSVASSVITRNYLMIQKYRNLSFKGDYMARGASLLIEAIDGNVDNMWITDRKDESYNKYYD